MKNWYAIYVHPRAEKKVSKFFEEKEIEYYLPLQKTLRQWKDRKKWVEMVVISGYIFVNINPKERIHVLKTDFVHGFVRYQGQDAVIPQEQIHTMKCILGHSELNVNIESGDYKKGQPIRVVSGPLTGLTGNLKSIKNRKTLIIHLEQMKMNIMVEIPVSQIEVIKEVTNKKTKV